MNLYRVTRKIHLVATLVLTTFIFMYFATGLIMIFEETFPRDNIKVDKIKERVDGIRSIEGDSLAEWSRGSIISAAGTSLKRTKKALYWISHVREQWLQYVSCVRTIQYMLKSSAGTLTRLCINIIGSTASPVAGPISRGQFCMTFLQFL